MPRRPPRVVALQVFVALLVLLAVTYVVRVNRMVPSGAVGSGARLQQQQQHTLPPHPHQRHREQHDAHRHGHGGSRPVPSRSHNHPNHHTHPDVRHAHTHGGDEGSNSEGGSEGSSQDGAAHAGHGLCASPLLSSRCRLPAGRSAKGLVAVEHAAGDVAADAVPKIPVFGVLSPREAADGSGSTSSEGGAGWSLEGEMKAMMDAQAKKMTAAVSKETIPARSVDLDAYASSGTSHVAVQCLDGDEGRAKQAPRVVLRTEAGSYLAETTLCNMWLLLSCRASPAAGLSPYVIASNKRCSKLEPEVAKYKVCSTLDISVAKKVVLGGKTALYKGKYEGKAVGLKHFTRKWYESFTGFHLFAAHSKVRHPYVNYPLTACEHRGTILQPQPWLKGRDLKKWRGEKESKAMEWPERLRWALRIACVHQFLHEHPHGPFTFDDNHPGQYFITKDGPVMIDIDTVQKTDAKGKSRCRCFGCNGGRANCQFLNSPEGYRYCGVGNDKQPQEGVPAFSCTTATDIWFLGQLLQMILPNGKAATMEKHGLQVGQQVWCTTHLSTRNACTHSRR